MSSAPDSNPYEAPGTPQVGGSQLLLAVRLPAMALMLMSIMSVIVLCPGLVASMQFVLDPSLQPNSGPVSFGQRIGRTAVLLLATVSDAFIFYAALNMFRGRHLSMVTIGVVLSLLPCFTPLFILGMPVGLWALFALSKPGVYDSFAD